jgi:endogenous inhibitor of DNA gyrase (YacG/DUF329 family)
MLSRQPCVFCRRREMDDRFRPFCSQRCKMADLGRWLTGEYHIPGQSTSGTDEADPPVAGDDAGEDAGVHR